MSVSPTREYQDGEDQAAYDKGYTRQRIKDALMIGLGSGLGGAAGWGAGELIKKYLVKASPKVSGVIAAAMPAFTAGISGYGTYLITERDNLKNAKAHRAGQDAVAAHRGQTKIARIVASPQEWSHTEKRTLQGAAAGGLAGLGVAGITASHPSMLKFGLPAAAIGAFLGRRKAKQELGQA